MIENKSAKLIHRKEICHERGKLPTVLYTYECACGEGTIQHETIPSLDESFLHIRCPHCCEKYKTEVCTCYAWKLKEK